MITPPTVSAFRASCMTSRTLLSISPSFAESGVCTSVFRDQPTYLPHRRFSLPPHPPPGSNSQNPVRKLPNRHPPPFVMGDFSSCNPASPAFCAPKTRATELPPRPCDFLRTCRQRARNEKAMPVMPAVAMAPAVTKLPPVRPLAWESSPAVGSGDRRAGGGGVFGNGVAGWNGGTGESRDHTLPGFLV